MSKNFPELANGILADLVVEGHEAHNSIVGQLLKDERIVTAMLAKMVWQAFQAASK